MKFVYDRRTALTRKREIDKKLEEKNAEFEKIDAQGELVNTIIVVVFSAMFAMVFFTVKRISLVIALTVLLFIIVSAAFFINLWFVRCQKNRIKYRKYPADVRFLVRTKNKKILKMYVEKSLDNNYLLKIKVKKRDGAVETICIALLQPCVRANIKEDIVNLTEGKYYIPNKK